MKTVTENLNRIIQAKSDIKNAIENKGVDVGDVTIDKYADKINQITSVDKPINVFSGLDLKEKELDLLGWEYPTGMKSLSGMFNGLPVSFISVGRWQTDDCEDMSYMFSTTLYLEEIKGLDDLNTSNVVNMRGMFESAFMHGTWNLDLSTWDVSKVKNMSNQFAYDTKLMGLDISGWDMSSVENANGMFSNCWELETLRFGGGLKVSTDFDGCDNLSVDSLLSVINGVANVRNVEQKPVLRFGAINLAKLTSEEKAIAINKGWSLE